MQDYKKVFIFGYSGHSYGIIESLYDTGYHIEGYFDLKKSEKNPFGLKYLGSEKEEDVCQIVFGNYVFPCVGDNKIRKELICFFKKNNLKEFVIIDKSASVSSSAFVLGSTYIGKNVVVNSQSHIGAGVILNTSCVVEHECIVSDYTHIAPGAVLCGSVKIGENCFIGANSVVKENVTISDEIIIGAGSVVLKNLIESGIWVGNKLKKL